MISQMRLIRVNFIDIRKKGLHSLKRLLSLAAGQAIKVFERCGLARLHDVA
jgi:hypothetical protein